MRSRKLIIEENGDLIVDGKRKFEHKWIQYLGIQYVHFVKESTKKYGIELTSKSKSTKKCFEFLINTTITINHLKRIVIHNQSHVSLIFEEIYFYYGDSEIKYDNPNCKNILIDRSILKMMS